MTAHFLVDCEFLDDFDKLMHDELWDGAWASEANNYILKMGFLSFVIR